VDRIADAREQLEARDDVRDEMLNRSRPITSKARTVMNLVHSGNLEKAAETYREAGGSADEVYEGLDEQPDLRRSGAFRNALQEVSEAWCFLSLVDVDVALPEKAMTPEAFVLGVGDVVGELRRRALDALIDERHADARERLDQMEKLYEGLRTIDVPSGVVDLKHKTDVAQTLIDKTRGKIALGRIEERMSEKAARYDETEPPT